MRSGRKEGTMNRKIKQVYEEHGIDKEKIRRAVLSRVKRRSYGFAVKPVLVSCIAFLVLAVCFSGFAISREVRAYNEALNFFDKYDLETTGLTRKEIKSVYRDISSGKFTYDKTAYVIEKSLGGHEIFQEDPTAEDLKNLWEYRKNKLLLVVKETPYRFETIMRYDAEKGYDVFDASIFSKYDNKKKVWSVEYDNFIIEDYTVYGDLICAYGYTPGASFQSSRACLSLISKDGIILWTVTLSNGFGNEYVGSVVLNDREIVVFSRGDLKYLCFSRLDLNGKLKTFTKTDIGNYGIWNSTRLGDGYLVQIGNYSKDGESFIKVDKNGVITDSFTYTSEDEIYYITDMIEYGGNVYLSAYSVPKISEGNNAGGRDEIASILKYIYDNQLLNISNEELTKLVRKNYTAVLLICDPETGVPGEFYSVEGSLGGELSFSEDGNLLWKVESITDTFLSLMTSSFTIGGQSYIYRYTFDDEGILIKQEKTGEIENYRR